MNNRFSNNLGQTPLHSNGMSDGVPTFQSFTEREKLERQRKVIRAYRDSHLGGRNSERGQVRPGARRSLASNTNNQSIGLQDVNNKGLDQNLPKQPVRFQEPPARTYNPYQ